MNHPAAVNLNTPETRIAVIGMDCIFPKAPNVKQFWQNIINGVNAIGDPLPEWNSKVHFARRGDTMTDQGGYLNELFRIDPVQFGIMPSALDGGEPDQFLALEVARRALADAGEAYLDQGFDHRDTGVILGHSPYYHRGQVNTAQHQIFVEQLREIVAALKPDMTREDEARLEDLLRSQLPPFTPDITPGLVPNVMTGRIANRLNLRGPNYMIDAACASSPLAVQAAVDELMNGTSRIMLVGGINASLPAEVAIIFTQLGALSAQGKVRPFCSTADGTLLGEGAGVIVLKRLDDALADGDRIYSVIRGVGQSSDGRGLGLLSPSQDGEALAMRRAYSKAGVDPDTVSLIEAHGTGIPLGDRTEISAIIDVFGPRKSDEGDIAIGSVKSMISHCIPAAGIAGLIKSSLALHHKVLPPSLCEDVNPDLGITKSRCFVNTTPRPWIHSLSKPRRAGINSFGFGGVNAHVILEAAPDDASTNPSMTPWSHELFVFAGADIEALGKELDRFSEFASARTDLAFVDIAASLTADRTDGPARLSIVASDLEDLMKKLALARKKLKAGKPFTTRNGLSFRSAPLDGRMAFMFAGEGSQYPSMFEDLAIRFPDVRAWLDFWLDSAASEDKANRIDIVYPRASERTEAKDEALRAQLFDMSVGSEAAFVGGQAMFALLDGLGLRPDAMVGHSTGESGALYAAGIVQSDTPENALSNFQKISEISGQVFESGQVPRGALLAAGLVDRPAVEAALKGTDAVIAMANCPTQLVVFAPEGEGEDVKARLVEIGAVVENLPFDRGYHTEGFRPMKDAFEAFYSNVGVSPSDVDVYSCATTGVFPSDPTKIVELAGRQWTECVNFIDTIKAMHDDGVRVFIEVGPGSKLSSFAQQILADREGDLLIAPGNIDTKPDMEVLLHLLGQLFTAGKCDPASVFEGRAVTVCKLDELTLPKSRMVAIDNTMPRIHATPELVDFLATLGLKTDSKPPPPKAASPAPDLSTPSKYALLGPVSRPDANTLTSDIAFETATTPFLQDHALSGPVSDDPALIGMACVPLMVSLEIMAEAAATLLDRADLVQVLDLACEGWVWADDTHTQLSARAVRIDDNIVAAEIWSDGKRAISARLRFGSPSEQAALLAPIVPTASYGWPEPYGLYRENIFHGPLFQTIEQVHAWGSTGIEAQLSNVETEGFLSEGETPTFILNPALCDAFTQITAFWLAEDRGPVFASFPRLIRQIDIFDDISGPTENLSLRAAQTEGPSGGNDGIWAVDCLKGDQISIQVRGMENAYSELPEKYYENALEPINGWLGMPVGLSDDNMVLDWHLPDYGPDLWRRVGGVFHRVLAFATLDPSERAVWHSVKHNADARDRYLLARVALKEAVRWWVAKNYGTRLYATDVPLAVTDTGTFNIDADWAEGLALTVSENETGIHVRLAATPIRPAFEQSHNIYQLENEL